MNYEKASNLDLFISYSNNGVSGHGLYSK